MRNKFIKLMALLLVLGMFFTTSGTAYALLGPVHIELNVMGERPSGVRAGQVTAFKIHIRFNVNIKVHDWIKIWFPIDENSCDLKDICDGIPQVTGAKESPRFVPNEAYFAKYQNKDESDVGKLYEVLDDRKGLTRFDKCECSAAAKDYGNCAQEGKCRVISDPTGLGCWVTGSVLPALPRDEAERYKRLAQIIVTTSIGYTPCTACQGLPYLINTAKERSYQVNSPLEVEAWRKGYNPIDFNTSKGTGIIAPMTPGRYRLTIATAPEPTPVESEYFVLPCSEISKPKVTLKPPDTDTVTEMKIKFNTGEGGALDADTSNIMIQFPNDYVLPGSIKPKMITVNGTPLNKPPQVVKTLNQVTITSPVAINNLSEVAVVFSDKIGMKNPVKIADYTLKVKTDSEPETIESEPFKVATVPVVEVNPNMEYNTAEYYAVGILPADSPIKSGQEFTVNFPKGTSIPKTIQPSSVIINGQPYKGTVNTGSETISLVASSDIVGALKVRFLVSAGIKNAAPGTYELTFTTGGKSFTFEKFEIIKSKPIIANVDITEEQGCEQSGYKFTYIPSFAGDLNPGDKLTVEFPENTRLPQAVSGDKVTIGGKPSQAVEIDGLKLVITVDTEVKAANGGALVDITKDAGVINTNYPGGYSLKVSTNKDEPISSPQFTITMPKVTSQLAFKDPAQPDGLEFEGCLWYKTPPVLSITSCNPYAKIFMWYDNKTDSIVQYTGEKRLSPASQRTTIWYYAQVGDVKEEPKPMKLCLDTILPSFSVIQPDMEKTITNKKTYTIKGERQPTEMLTDGDNEKYQVVDGVYINGKQLLSPEIFETANRDSIKMTFEATVDLKEGENVVEIKGIDQAGNERTIKKIIILDTKAPEIVVVKPDPKELQKPGENIAIQVKSETDASVFINGQIAQKIEELSDGKTAIFEAGWDVVKGENKVEITSTDVAGNTATTYLTFKGGSKSTVIELWVGKTDFIVNGEKMPNLATAPTASSPPLPKTFAGTTFMPVADVAKALGVEVTYEGKTKMVTLTQTLDNGTKKVIQLWINKKQAKIDGKDVWIDTKKVLYPTILSGKTMLPLRFVAENLNCDVKYDTKTKKITVTYPKP